MPMSFEFVQRISDRLYDIADHFGTPFYLYDEVGIQATGEYLTKTFSWHPQFKEYFAVKATPNLHILRILKSLGFGFDCSSIPELVLARMVGANGEDIMFTSNNTTRQEFQVAFGDGGAIMNVDDSSLLEKMPRFPELIAFRYNPGSRRTGNTILGKPEESKFGVPHEKILEAYTIAKERGAKRFGIHTMLVSNELDYKYMVQTAEMLLNLVTEIGEALGIQFEFVNIGGGVGIPYHPDDEPLDLERMSDEIHQLFHVFERDQGYMPALYMECGRYMTGPHGVLVTKVNSRKFGYRNFIGVDASMSALMRPAMYNAYHHIHLHSLNNNADEMLVDVVGSLCENNDKFAVQRKMPLPEIGDLLVIQDAGAHGHAMGFNYNGRLRPKELLLRSDGSVQLIRRAETLDDYLATLEFEDDVY